MSSPQLEDGYTRVANQILDRIMQLPLSGSQLRIVIAVWRYTYGFNRKDHGMSIDFLTEATGLNRSNVKKELKNLVDYRVLIVTREQAGVNPRKMAFNKNSEEWCKPVGGVNRPPEEQEDLLGGVNQPPLEGVDTHPVVGVDSPPKKYKRKKDNIYSDIIAYLNEKAGRKYSAKVKTTQEMINGRIAEGRTVEDFYQVIDTKCVQWLDDPKMSKYLRPQTLFRPGNFDKYLNEPTPLLVTPGSDTAAREEKMDYEDALREWVMSGGTPDTFVYNE